MTKRLKILFLSIGIVILLFLFVFFFFFGSKTISSNDKLTIKEKEYIENICNIVLSDENCIKNIKLLEQSSATFYVIEISDSNFINNNNNIEVYTLNNKFSIFPALKYMPKKDKFTYFKDEKNEKIYISTYSSETVELKPLIKK